MGHKCPACGSDQTASIKIAQARETKTGKFGALGIDMGGDVGFFGGGSATTSKFAASLTQPKIPEKSGQDVPAGLIILGWAVAIGCIAWAFFAERQADKASRFMTAAFGIFAALVGHYWMRSNEKRNAMIPDMTAADIAKRKDEWERQWVCYQCGEKFTPPTKGS